MNANHAMTVSWTRTSLEVARFVLSDRTDGIDPATLAALQDILVFNLWLEIGLGSMGGAVENEHWKLLKSWPPE